MRLRRALWIPPCVLLLCWLSASAGAQVKFQDSSYRDLISADADQTIPPGTRITVGNWRQYARFMPVGMQALFSGHYLFKFNDNPAYALLVGPTTKIPRPRQFVADSERYAGQAKLVALAGGGYTVSGYVAGMPFVRPEEPNKAEKLFFNTWYAFRPFMAYYDSNGCQIDRYFSIREQDSTVYQVRLDHLSDPPLPRTMPGGKGHLFTGRFMQITPEQSKYTTALSIYSDDPAKVQEAYVFLPSLRRSLRLSSAARCSPILGSDFIQDDALQGVGFQPSNFAFKFLGKKRILLMANADPRIGIKSESYKFGAPAGAWPKPSIGRWELRDVDIVDVTPLAELHGYCYGHKVLYIDSDSSLPMWIDIYDAQDNLWKTLEEYYWPQQLNDAERVLIGNTIPIIARDLQNGHITVSIAGALQIDKDVSSELKDYQVYAFPSGLSRILR